LIASGAGAGQPLNEELHRVSSTTLRCIRDSFLKSVEAVAWAFRRAASQLYGTAASYIEGHAARCICAPVESIESDGDNVRLRLAGRVRAG